LLQSDLAQALPPVLGDRVQLQQVLLNLIINGIEAMTAVTDQPRSLWVESRIDESGDILVAVRDSGIGLSLEADRVFTAFFTTKANGMGMGLSISRSLIEAHGGRLWATPNFPTALCFLHAASRRRESLMTRASVVFVVDDDPSIRSSLKFLLSSVGLQVRALNRRKPSCKGNRQMHPVALCWTSDYVD